MFITSKTKELQRRCGKHPPKDWLENKKTRVYGIRVGKDLNTGRAYHDMSLADLVISSSEILPIVNELKVFEFNPFLVTYIAQYHELNCLNFANGVCNFNGANNYGNQVPISRYVWEEPKEQIL